MAKNTEVTGQPHEEHRGEDQLMGQAPDWWRLAFLNWTILYVPLHITFKFGINMLKINCFIAFYRQIVKGVKLWTWCGEPAISLHSHQSHWSSGLPVCFPSQGTKVQIPWGDLFEAGILLLTLSRYIGDPDMIDHHGLV
jgi:hypothetical protein